jgi:hypothetical protein
MYKFMLTFVPVVGLVLIVKLVLVVEVVPACFG